VRIETDVIDGVRVLWADTGDGPYIGALEFGVGRADETAVVGGITHLVEHLALAPFGLQEFDHNGFVDPVRSVFHAAGTADEVSAHVTAVARSIHHLPLDRLGVERRILRDEAAQNGQAIGGALRWYRFGATGHGLPGIEELGLFWLGPDRVREWAGTRYGRWNAVLWLSGPPPAGLRIELPDVVPPARPAVTPLAGVRYPACVPWQGPGVAISYLAPRSFASTVAASILERRARQRLRFDEGLVYDIATDYEPLGLDTAHAIIGADCPDERIPAVRDALLAVIGELAEHGPTDAELASETNGFRRGFDDRDGRLASLDFAAAETLLGRPLRQPDDLAAERAAVTASEARDAFATGLESMLLLAKAEPLSAAPWNLYPGWSQGPVKGRELRPSGFHLPGRGPRERLVVGADGISFVGLEGAVTVRWADVVAVSHDAPDARLVFGSDGFTVGVAAPAWRDGPDAVAAVDAAIPAELVVCSVHGIGGLEAPDDPPGCAAA
jgi:hypothetical protein